MKLETITLHHIKMPLVAPFTTSFGSIDTRECIILEVNAGGLVGWGECVADRDPGYGYETAGTAWHILRDFLIPSIMGQEINDIEDLNRKIAHVRGHLMAKAGLEMAIWDLIDIPPRIKAIPKERMMVATSNSAYRDKIMLNDSKTVPMM